MSAPTPDTPQVLLEHHLKALRLPTMLREYDKLARTCAQEKAAFPHYLLRLIETFPLTEVTAAVEQALGLNAISFDAVRHLVLCRIERRPPRLDMANWPHLPLAQVRTTRPADYLSLLSMPAAEAPRMEATL